MTDPKVLPYGAPPGPCKYFSSGSLRVLLGRVPIFSHTFFLIGMSAKTPSLSNPPSLSLSPSFSFHFQCLLSTYICIY